MHGNVNWFLLKTLARIMAAMLLSKEHLVSMTDPFDPFSAGSVGGGLSFWTAPFLGSLEGF